MARVESEAGRVAGGAGATTRGMLKVWRARGEVAGGRDELVRRVLRSRGLEGDEAFLLPTMKNLHDPSLMPGLDRAAERLLGAARAGERIVIYGDYDVDGVTATAILFHMLREIVPACDVATYVPHRIEEGYGLQEASIRALCTGEGFEKPARVIVSVDCGVTAIGPALVAKSLGVDLIITDHHNPPAAVQDVPDAYAVVHPRLPGSGYPFGELCGAGVAYKLAWRMATMACGSERVSERLRGILLELLGLCSLGIVADVVPLVDENRVLARFGLAKIKHSANEGLRALVEASGLSGENIKAEDVGFRLAPPLNACGRLGHAREAVELLTTASGVRAREIATELARLNRERRGVERQIFVEACEMAEKLGMTGEDRRAIVLSSAAWHAGVVGIVCSRLVEKYGRPAILLCERESEEGGALCHGSGRSVDGVNLHGAIARCAEHVVSFGGHDMAAGLKVKRENVERFREAFVACVNEEHPVEGLCAKAQYDCEATLAELTAERVHALQAFAPFGRGNPDVTLVARGVQIKSRPQLLGQDGKHLSLSLGDGGKCVLRGVAWGWGGFVETLRQGQRVDVLCRPAINTWRGASNVELEVLDVAVLDG